MLREVEVFTIHIYRRFYDLFAYEADSTAEHIENWESAIMTWEEFIGEHQVAGQLVGRSWGKL